MSQVLNKLRVYINITKYIKATDLLVSKTILINRFENPLALLKNILKFITHTKIFFNRVSYFNLIRTKYSML